MGWPLYILQSLSTHLDPSGLLRRLDCDAAAGDILAVVYCSSVLLIHVLVLVFLARRMKRRTIAKYRYQVILTRYDSISKIMAAIDNEAGQWNEGVKEGTNLTAHTHLIRVL